MLRAHLVILQDGATEYCLRPRRLYLLAAGGSAARDTVFRRQGGCVPGGRMLTIFVLAVIVFTLGRWILRLQTFGSLIDTARRMEDQTTSEFALRGRSRTRWAMPFARPGAADVGAGSVARGWGKCRASTCRNRRFVPNTVSTFLADTADRRTGRGGRTDAGACHRPRGAGGAEAAAASAVRTVHRAADPGRGHAWRPALDRQA